MDRFELPKSDCGCIVAGDLTGMATPPECEPGEEAPKYGVIVWYKSKEAIKDACNAVTKAHWSAP